MVNEKRNSFWAGREKQLSATECSELKSAGVAAARPATAECLLLLQPAGGHCAVSRAQATSSGWYSELLSGTPLSGHSSESVAGGWRCLPPACHGHCTVFKWRSAGLECSLFITPVVVYYIAVLSLFQWFIISYIARFIAIRKCHTGC